MKRITHLLCSAFLLLGLSTQSSQAQLAPGTIAPDFTLTDLDGNQHHLYEYLDQGKIVVLDVFAVWCGPCWAYAPILEQAYEEHGPNGDNTMVFLALEGDDQTTDDLQHPDGEAGDWASAIAYPIINQTGSMPDNYNIAYFPTLYMICPGSKETYELNQPEASEYAALASLNCPSQSGVNNARAVSYTGDAEFQNCESFTPKVMLQNLGSTNLTSAKLDLYFGGELKETKNWTGNLETFDAETVIFAAIGDKKSAEVKVEVSLPNGAIDDDNSNNEASKDITFRQSSKNLTMTLHTDKWPEEIHWKVKSPSGTLISQNGTLQCETTYTDNITISDDGCYTLELTDDYGDGILSGPINPTSHSCTNGDAGVTEGSVELKDDAGNIIWNSVSYGEGISVKFYAGVVALQADFTVSVNQDNNTVSVTNTSQGATNYLWSWGDNTTSLQQNPEPHLYPTAGIYTVTLTAFDSDGNNNVYTTNVTINETVGLEQLNIRQLSVSPVPASDMLNVQFATATAQELTFEVVNILGQSVMQFSKQYGNGNNNEQIAVAQLLNGSYTLNVKDVQGNKATVRFVVAR
ncbi:MAG: redoxin domain-containing protein [Sphingobacteriales bacterium]|nr:redoxin domain-containing protein [Sphingobacteriales bacterium]